MGTVTAIGGYEPARDPSRPTWGAPSATVTSLTYISGTRASISLDSWETAIAAAMVAARTAANVRVNKVGLAWVVSWDAPVFIDPTYPYQQPWTWPYSYTSGGA